MAVDQQIDGAQPSGSSRWREWRRQRGDRPGGLPAGGDRRRRGRWSTEEVTGRVVGRGAVWFVGGGELASADTDVDGELSGSVLCTEKGTERCG